MHVHATTDPHPEWKKKKHSTQQSTGIFRHIDFSERKIYLLRHDHVGVVGAVDGLGHRVLVHADRLDVEKACGSWICFFYLRNSLHRRKKQTTKLQVKIANAKLGISFNSASFCGGSLTHLMLQRCTGPWEGCQKYQKFYCWPCNGFYYEISVELKKICDDWDFSSFFEPVQIFLGRAALQLRRSLFTEAIAGAVN